MHMSLCVWDKNRMESAEKSNKIQMKCLYFGVCWIESAKRAFVLAATSD